MRAPLLAGYLWLLFAYLLSANDLSDPAPGSLVAALAPLADRVGTAGLFTAATIAAYLIGSASDHLTNWLLGGLLRQSGQVEIERLRKDAIETARRDLGVDESELPDDLARTIHVLTVRASQRLREQPAARSVLLADELSTELVEAIDRASAEAQLRVDVTPPLLALVVYLTAEYSGWWAGGLVVAYLLFRQGFLLIREADGMIEAGRGPQGTAFSAVKLLRRSLDELELRTWEPDPAMLRDIHIWEDRRPEPTTAEPSQPPAAERAR